MTTTEDARPVPDAAIQDVLDALLDLEIAERTEGARFARRFSLSDSDLTALALLARSGSQQVTGLAALLQLTPGSTSTLVARLCDRGLIERRRSTADRRIVEVQLTDVGGDVVRAMHARFRAAVVSALTHATEECLVTTSRVLRSTAAGLLV